MLHGFSETTGREVVAYIPGALYSTVPSEGMHYLADPAYAHRYYVDLTPTATDAYIKTKTGGAVGWKTVLVGGLRGGGRGMFALDVTTPSFSESGTGPEDAVMWEFTDADDVDLGYTFSRPSIVLLDNGEWAAVFGNGYNDGGSGEAQLYIVFLEGGLDGTWTSGTDYIKISTGVGSTATRNGLATPAVIDADGNGTADRVYAGDLEGNMWAFDISGSNANNWDVAYKAGSTPKPLFTAESGQAITTTPVIVRNPEVPISAANIPNTLVIFGTGQYLVSGDNTTTTTQSFYGVWDSGSSELAQSDLVEQTIGTGTNANGVPGRTLTNNYVDYANGVDGWYMDLPVSGERVITDPIIRGDLVYFNTAIPDSGLCSSGGTGWLMVAKLANGGRPDNVAFDLDGNGTIEGLDEINNEAPAGQEIYGLPSSPAILGNKRYTSSTDTKNGSSIGEDEIENISNQNTGRLSWEELSR
jgi:type IV pilus assembly protein PilY1